MTHYLLTHFDDQGCAVLETAEGSSICVPVAWLPAGVRQGSSLTITFTPAGDEVRVSIQLDEGVDEPGGVNVGG
jgi:hypothetical protein